jgi:hypothetical protein
MYQRSGMMTPIRNLIFALFLLSCAPSHLPNSVSSLELEHVCNVDAQCQNEGTCVIEDQPSNRTHCQCQDGFSGPRCAHHCPYDCKNGGYCTVTPQGEASDLVLLEPEPDDFMCKCFGRFSGPLCETPYVNCGENERCFNGGICVVDDTDGKHRCSCPDGWDGDSCKSEIETVESKQTFGETLTKTKEGKAGLAVIGILLVVVTAILVMVSNRRRDSNFSHFLQEDLEYEDFYDMPSIEDERTHSSKQLILNVV